jgi:hypothetical protein
LPQVRRLPPQPNTAAPPEPRALVSAPQPRDVATLPAGSVGAGLAVAVKSVSSVTLDVAVFDGAPRGLESSEPQERAAQARRRAVGAQRFSLSLPGTAEPVVARVRTTYEFVPGVLTHVGQIEGREDSAFSLAIDSTGSSPQAIAKLHLGDRLYVLSPEGEGHTLIEIDKRRVPQAPRICASTPARRPRNRSSRRSCRATSPAAAAMFASWCCTPRTSGRRTTSAPFPARSWANSTTA